MCQTSIVCPPLEVRNKKPAAEEATVIAAEDPSSDESSDDSEGLESSPDDISDVTDDVVVGARRPLADKNCNAACGFTYLVVSWVL